MVLVARCEIPSTEENRKDSLNKHRLDEIHIRRFDIDQMPRPVALGDKH